MKGSLGCNCLVVYESALSSDSVSLGFSDSGLKAFELEVLEFKALDIRELRVAQGNRYWTLEAVGYPMLG